MLVCAEHKTQILNCELYPESFISVAGMKPGFLKYQVPPLQHCPKTLYKIFIEF